MRHVLASCGWPERALPPRAWRWADTMGRSITLAHDTGDGEPVDAASNEHRTVYAVFAGALYNGRQLRTALAGQHALAGRDDAEVVVHLYEERGVQCVKALRGAFAFALWDERRQRLLIARDQLGLVPLYYAADGHRLVVSSTLPAVMTFPGAAGTWDAAALDAFLTFGAVPPPATFHTGIRQLGPGELAVWEDGRVRTQRYWQLTFPERRMTRPDVPAVLREQMLEAHRLRQAGMVTGMLLSPGLDAAAVVAMTSADGRLPAAAYTAAFADGDPEMRAAAGLASRAGIPHVVAPGGDDWAAAVDALMAAHGGPVGGPELVAIQRAAARAGEDVGVLLAGIGGEEVFGGSGPVRAAERLRRYRELPSLAREGAQMWARVAPPRWTEHLRRLIDQERLAPLELYARAASAVLPEHRTELYTPDTLAMLGDARPWAALTTLFSEAVSGGGEETLDAIHYVELTLGLPARAVAASVASGGLELRLPLADHRLAQFVASVPPSDRGNASDRQLLLRHALADLLPRGTDRRAHARTLPAGPGWGAFLDDTLAPDRLELQGFFRPATVTRLRAEHASGRRDHADLLWRIALTTRWLARQTLAAAPAVRAAG